MMKDNVNRIIRRGMKMPVLVLGGLIIAVLMPVAFVAAVLLVSWEKAWTNVTDFLTWLGEIDG